MQKKIAEYLEGRKEVAWVNYPMGLLVSQKDKPGFCVKSLRYLQDDI